MSYSWIGILDVSAIEYICMCGNKVASNKGWSTSHHPWEIRICPFCSKPTFFDESRRQTPGVKFGNPVSNITDQSILELYEEARNSFSVNAFTSTVLACRKLLMHISVSKGAEEGKNFLFYVQYLSDNHIIPAGSQAWVDHIREKGNEANHEIVIMSQSEAEILLTFSEMLLKLIYEFPSKLPIPSVSP